MKFRKGFVTNSSSSSFIVENLSNRVLGNEDIARMMEVEFHNFVKNGWGREDDTFEEFIISSNSQPFILGPSEKITIECGDHRDDGLFENVIHFEDNIHYNDFKIIFEESHH